MFAVTRSIRILIFILLVNDISCQDVFTEHDFRRLQQQIASNDGQDLATSYTNTQTDQIRNDQQANSMNIQYHLAQENEDYRSNHGRSDRRKVIRIKNPFQRQMEEGERHQQDNSVLKDSDGGASNQYAAMQYSLPPEDFLRQMRAESQFNQQYSTPAPAALSYTATPQPQYQYSTPAPSYDNNQQTLQFGQLDSKIAQAQAYHGNPPSNYQFSGSYSFDGSTGGSASAFESMQSSPASTPSPIPPFLSTATNNQYIGTPASTFVSSSSPVVSSQSNIQYVSSPAAVQSSSIDYTRSSTSSNNNNNYENSEINKRIQIDHYDNSATGIRYPIQQYASNDYPSSTAAPPSFSPYSEQVNDNWNYNPSTNALAKSLQEATIAHYQNLPYYNLAQDTRYDYQESGDNHRIGNMPAANNVYLNYAHPDYQSHNGRSRTRDLEQETGQAEYSNGEYGWKLNDKKPLQSNDYYSHGSLPVHYQSSLHSDSPQSQYMSFRHDSNRPHSYDSISKSAQDSLDAQEFAKAAAKAHESMKQQQAVKANAPYFGHNYASSFSTSDPIMNSQSQPQNIVSTFYGNLEKQKSKLFPDSSNNSPVIFSSSQQDLITASPYYHINTKENSLETKAKLPFDHAKALKQIVPIDVSNVINNNEAALKAAQENRLNLPNFSRDQVEQSLKQFYKPISDTYYKDKNSGYGFNIKAKPDDTTSPESTKPYENQQFYLKLQENSYNQAPTKYTDQASQQNYQTQTSSYSNNQQQASNTPRQQNLAQSDFTSILKLNDIPYRLTQGIPPEALRLHNNNFDQASIPTPIPGKINQNVGNHQIDVANSILNKLLQQAKQSNINGNIDLQPTAPMSTVNGFRIVNPFNVDLKLVHDMLKGKPVIDDSQISYLRDQYNKPMPVKFDMSAIQQLLLRNDNFGNFGPTNDGLGPYTNPYLDVYGRYPYQGVKYSRSQEEEESLIPIADASSNHPIGAVIEQYDAPDGREALSGSELSGRDEDVAQTEEKPEKNTYRDLKLGERHRHPNSLPGRHFFQRKYPKSDLEQYLLLKPPPMSSLRSRSSYTKLDRRGRRRVVGRKPKFTRSLKAEAVLENDSKPMEESDVPLLLQPPPIAEGRSEKSTQDESS